MLFWIMKKVYICSPFTGDIKKNIENAKIYSRSVYKLGYLPICVHIYLEEATGLCEVNGDREELLKLGREMVKICDEIFVFGRESSGMKGEIKLAKRLKKKITYWNGNEE